MSKWFDAVLGDVAVVKSGFAFKSKDWVEEGIPVCKILNVRDGRVNLQSCSYVSKDVARSASRFRLKRGDVLVAMSGATLGSLGVYQSDEHAVVNQRVGIVEPHSGDVTVQNFLGYALQHPDAYAEMQRIGYGSAQPNISPSLLATLAIRISDSNTLAKVSSILRSIDDLIENNRRRIGLLEQMAQAIYREWFVKFRYPGHEHATFTDSLLGPIPSDWRADALSSVVKTQYGFTESATTAPIGPRYLRGMDINKTSFVDWSSVPFCPISDREKEKFRIGRGDVFVIRMADPGKVGICEEDVDAVFASYLVRLRPVDGRIEPYFLFFTLADDAYQNWVTGASTGSTRKSVSAAVMTEPLVAMPPILLQQNFVTVILPLRQNLSGLLRWNNSLVTIRDVLLPKLVTGQIDVSSLDLDALLEGVA
jgi:type I restriction enzyme, S subunit